MNRTEYNQRKYAEQKARDEAVRRFKELYPERFAQLIEKAKQPITYTPVTSTVHSSSLHGFPHCPTCKRLLSLNNMPDIGETYWKCSVHGWLTTDEVIKGEEQLVTV